MKTPNSKAVKSFLKASEIDVKRLVIFNGKLTVTVALRDADRTEKLLSDLNVMQQRTNNPARVARANRIPMLGVAEFTSLMQDVI